MASLRSASLDERDSLIRSKAAEAGKASIKNLVNHNRESYTEGIKAPFLSVISGAGLGRLLAAED